MRAKVPSPRFMMRDRVDIISRRQDVIEGKLTRFDDRVEKGNVRCAILTNIPQELQTLLGVTTFHGPIGLFDKHAPLKQGWRLRVRGDGVWYSVGTVARHPSPHRYDIQVVELKQDLTEVA